MREFSPRQERHCLAPLELFDIYTLPISEDNESDTNGKDDYTDKQCKTIQTSLTPIVPVF